MTRRAPSLAVVVPTKNRPDDLAITIEGVLRQTVIPKQLIVVDQSANDESRKRVVALFAKLRQDICTSLELLHIHDVLLSGLTAARNRALKVVNAEIVLFLDDDVVLERDFMEQIIAVFRDNPLATGVSGIVTNYSRPPLAFRWWSSLFTRGPFRDDRQPVYWKANQLRGAKPIQVTRLGGGLMAFRIAAIAGISFDENLHGSCPGEDVEFCARLGGGAVLLIAPNARLVHNHSPSGRSSEHWLIRHAWTMGYLYHRSWRHGVINRLWFFWLNIGYIISATFTSTRRLSLAPWWGVVRSNRDSRRAARATALATNSELRGVDEPSEAIRQGLVQRSFGSQADERSFQTRNE